MLTRTTLQPNVVWDRETGTLFYVFQGHRRRVPTVLSGIAEVDFGAFPGKTDASTTVTGQISIGATTLVQAWITPVDTTDHSADEHMIVDLRCYARNVVAGVGFDIFVHQGGSVFPPDPGTNQVAMIYGKWSVAWRWST